MKKLPEQLPNYVKSQGIPVSVDLRYLWGTQPVSEYCASKKANIDRAFVTEGLNLLRRKPVHLALVDYENGSCLPILDGHHRAREAAKFGYVVIPCLVFSLALISDILGEPEQELREELECWTTEAIKDFESHYARSQKPYTPPKILPGVKTVRDLQELASHDNEFGIYAYAALEVIQQ